MTKQQSTEESVNVTNPEESVTIKEQTPSAADGTAEDTLAESYKKIVEQMKAQNDLLIKTNESLQNQIGVLIRNGNSPAPINQETKSEPEPESEPYVSLAELGTEIGKRDYKVHNLNSN